MVVSCIKGKTEALKVGGSGGGGSSSNNDNNNKNNNDNINKNSPSLSMFVPSFVCGSCKCI
jgi:hypothetical protein